MPQRTSSKTRAALIELRESLPKKPKTGTAWLWKLGKQIASVKAYWQQDRETIETLRKRMNYVTALVLAIEADVPRLPALEAIAKQFSKTLRQVYRDARSIELGNWSLVIFGRIGSKRSAPKPPTRKKPRLRTIWSFRTLRSDGSISYHRTERAALVAAVTRGLDLICVEPWGKLKEIS